jgi:hypothetical protein
VCRNHNQRPATMAQNSMALQYLAVCGVPDSNEVLR